MIRLGTAGWTIPARFRYLFPESGSSLARYAGRFTVAEINSTFHRSHRRQTYERWAAAVPDDFRFAVKLPKIITHERRLVDTAEPLKGFLEEVSALHPKMGPLLVQLPPSLAFDESVVGRFLHLLRSLFEGATVCEPRHASWFESRADGLLADRGVARVAADPARVPEAAVPGGSRHLAYFRLHGSPRMYYSAYEHPFLAILADRLTATEAAETWCIFDNTASGAALGDAMTLENMVGEPRCAL